jgi:hypothetical protein
MKGRAFIPMVLVFLGACDLWSQPIDPIAFQRQADEIIIHMRACGDDRIESVMLIYSEDPLIEGTDERLWRIEAREPRALTEVALGKVPDGYAETTRLREEVSEESILSVRVLLEGGDRYLADFKLSELPSDGKLFMVNEIITEADFAEVADRECRDRR